ncbi:phenol hydroxylase subunit [Pigmentiphaga sp. NML030171]|uniref:phenol hydroxylase subunit n=1 Tax=Pigmentiphaga sp. NML030171 TaxID=2008676 RepID=UPI001C3D83FD|nr:phenol hydroxylase subunit [Pigmentiphaga sp. NML030171]
MITGRLRYVEFEFSIGDPELAVELVLAFPQFQEFCRRNRVRMVGAEEAARLDLERMKWRYGSPGLAE